MNRKHLTVLLTLFTFHTCGQAVVARAADDIVIADFEGPDYGNWKVTGEAFGPGPARGTLPGQQEVTGFRGKGLVNSFFHADVPTGTLTSPTFKIERKYINLLVGGGKDGNALYVALLVDGKIVRKATGNDDERLEAAVWDVTNLAGAEACIEIVDKATGQWGHINVDQIVQSDKPVAPYVKPAIYAERYRPQFHFTPRTNWTNDPNGLVFYKGRYHLFFQHNPTGINWGNMTWGHAVSPDMFHWTQLDDAIKPDKLGTIFSGSAVVDTENTAGFQQGDDKTIVCIFTSAGQPYTQSIAYSTDGGNTFKKYENNPVLKHIVGGNRDPKVFWHAPSKKWIMALFLDGNTYAILNSSDLKSWTKLCDVPFPGTSECPDFFALPVDGDANNMKWVFWGANNNYMLGTFDGKEFHKEAGPLQSHFGANRYASQSYSDIPAADGRRIQIAWMADGKYPGMPFNQQMSVPAELTLRKFPEGVRLCTLPVREVDQLHQGEKFTFQGPLKSGDNPLRELPGELFDIRLKIEPGTASEISLNIRGTAVRYDVKEGKLSCMGHSARIELIDGCLSLRVLVDRSSIEIFTADGRVNMAYCFLPREDDKSLALSAIGGEANVRELEVWQMQSTWPQASLDRAVKSR